jgi:hypothetical protein
MFSDPPDGYVKAEEACRVLGISDRTLRRRVQAGTVEGEYIPRPQGSILYVKLPSGTVPQTAGDAAPDGDASSEEPESAPETRQDAALVAMLLERIDAKDAAILAATERAVRAEAERDAARQAAAEVKEELAAERAETARLREKAERPWWQRRWW